ncbi:molybdate transport system substrate-binding protein [Saccharopolyspora erythraea NRRL 2338]|nr:molybdate ABC transporter substrate-binding protein [Saccharopolyspora erythraea]PFG93719.1 molybdate transport system substrate-binding protein [Saccharopolyspora erythraea NRRL 2338]QRK93271.1 molybdate ABC transporter substrate-binding protein [Saccharopolyspora erythraea]
MSRIRPAVAGLVAVLLLGGCGQASPQQQQQERTLTVLAAASLTESFDEIGRRFAAEHPGVRVQFDYQGSSTLAEQINQGRSADVFASADTRNMDKAAANLAAPAETFATNRLAIAVPKGNPARVASLADLAAAGRVVVVCAPQVPCGSATEKIERAAGVRLRPSSEEDDVKAVLQKVSAGEADAGLVYVSDARSAAGEVDSVEFPESGKAVNTYPIAALKNAPQAELAKQFLAYVRGPVGREVLTAHGFATP